MILGIFFMSYKKQDIEYMQRAIELARRGAGFVNPNPMVGCVVVKNDTVITEGYHEYYGGFHAERNALTNCTSDCKDATLYVTASPCVECAKLIIQAGIKRVVYRDAYRITDGIDLLRRAGIEVEQVQ